MGKGHSEIFDRTDKNMEKRLQNMIKKSGIPTLCNFNLDFEPGICEWFFPKNDCYFFVPPEKPIMFYFKLKMG